MPKLPEKHFCVVLNMMCASCCADKCSLGHVGQWYFSPSVCERESVHGCRKGNNLQKKKNIVSDPVILSHDSMHDQSHADRLMHTHHLLNTVHGGPEIVKRNTSYEELCQVENKRADSEKT